MATQIHSQALSTPRSPLYQAACWTDVFLIVTILLFIVVGCVALGAETVTQVLMTPALSLTMGILMAAATFAIIMEGYTYKPHDGEILTTRWTELIFPMRIVLAFGMMMPRNDGINTLILMLAEAIRIIG